jgi:hypothetical protein
MFMHLSKISLLTVRLEKSAYKFLPDHDTMAKERQVALGKMYYFFFG